MAVLVRFGQSERYIITGKPSAKISDFVTYLSALFGNLVPIICPSLPYNGQEKRRLLFIMKE